MVCLLAARRTTREDPTNHLLRRRKPDKEKAFRRLWNIGSFEDRGQLRQQFGWDHKRYYRSYQPDEEDFCWFQELGMLAFVKLEKRLLKQFRLQSYRASGKASLERFTAALNSESFVKPNVVLVSLDFEGLPDFKGINEVGFAKLEMNPVCSTPECLQVEATNFALRNHRSRKFAFGNTTRIHFDILRTTLVDVFENFVQGDSRCEVVLISHGVRQEIQIMDDIGVFIEDLPITGVADTHEYSKEILGHNAGSLEELLSTLEIECRWNSLHCAGNDAHYTLQALLALLQIRHGDPYGRLEKLARQPVPRPPSWKTGDEVEEDWINHLDGNASCLETEEGHEHLSS